MFYNTLIAMFLFHMPRLAVAALVRVYSKEQVGLKFYSFFTLLYARPPPTLLPSLSHLHCAGPGRQPAAELHLPRLRRALLLARCCSAAGLCHGGFSL